MIHLGRMKYFEGTWTGSRDSYCGKQGPITGQEWRVSCPACKAFILPNGRKMPPEQAERLRQDMASDREVDSGD